MLEHHADAERRAPPAGCASCTGSPFQRISPSSGCDRAVDDLHQRRLAGAVLAEHGVDLARLDAQARRRSLALTAGYCLLMPVELERMGRDSSLRSGCSGGSRMTGARHRRSGSRARRRHVASTRLRSSPSVIHANTRSCKLRATSWRRCATGPSAQSQTQTSAVAAGLERADLVAEAERLGRAARRRVQRLPGRQALAGHRLHLVGVGHACAASTGWCRRRRRWRALTRDAGRSAARQSNRPLPRNRFDDGLCAICAPAVAQRGAVGVVEPDAVGEHARARAAGRRGRRRRGSCARRGTARAPSATSARFSARWVCM